MPEARLPDMKGGPGQRHDIKQAAPFDQVETRSGRQKSAFGACNLASANGQSRLPKESSRPVSDIVVAKQGRRHGRKRPCLLD